MKQELVSMHVVCVTAVFLVSSYRQLSVKCAIFFRLTSFSYDVIFSSLILYTVRCWSAVSVVLLFGIVHVQWCWKRLR